jgi:uncharacterized protein involved in cysteine biosynthesis
MSAVIAALAKAFGQLSDRAVLAVLAKSLGVTLLAFALFGVVLYAALIWAFAAAGLSEGGLASATAAALIAALAGWLLFRVVAIAVLQFFADEVVEAVEARHYPVAAASARKLPFSRELANSLRGIGRTLVANALALPVALALTVTGVGAPLVFLAVNAWLLGRELTDMAWLRHCGDAPGQNPVSRTERFLLGIAIAGIMLVPFASLIGPIMGAAAGTHLTMRAMTLRARERDASA